MINSLIRIFKSGLISFWRNRWLSVAAVIMMSLTIFVITSLIMVSVMTSSLVKTLQDKIDVSVYFMPDAEQSDILKTRDDLMALKEVSNVEYMSEEDALASFKEKHKENSVLMQSLREIDGNPLGAILNIKAEAVSMYDFVVNYLNQEKYKQIIDKINYRENKTVIAKINGITSTIQRTGLVISIILAVMAILVAFNTIRLTMYSAREEINIMKLVGASRWFIRGPFLVEGALYGLVAGVLTLLIFYPILWYTSPKVTAFLPGTDLLYYYQTHFLFLLGLQIAVGICLGILSSLVAIRRYLKEQKA